MVNLAPRRCVFFDRDGVLNQSIVIDGKPYAPRSLEEFKVCPQAASVTDYLYAKGYLLFVVSNQPDVGNGLVEKSLVESFNKAILEKMPISKIYCCLHSQSEGCSCRKPEVGLFKQAFSEHLVSDFDGWMIGDRAIDMEAGRNIGLKTIFLDHGYRESEQPEDSMVDFAISSLEELKQIII